MEHGSTSETVENYLKAIYELEEETGRVGTKALAERLGVSSPSVTAMLKRLGEEEGGLVEYRRHRGVVLTTAGRARALETIRHHRLLETFLYEVLGFTWDEVHEEALAHEHEMDEKEVRGQQDPDGRQSESDNIGPNEAEMGDKELIRHKSAKGSAGLGIADAVGHIHLQQAGYGAGEHGEAGDPGENPVHGAVGDEHERPDEEEGVDNVGGVPHHKGENTGDDGARRAEKVGHFGHPVEGAAVEPLGREAVRYQGEEKEGGHAKEQDATDFAGAFLGYFPGGAHDQNRLLCSE